MKKVLLFSSLCKEKSILEIAVPTWLTQECENLQLDLLFYDDNKSVEASEYISNLAQENKRVNLLDGLFKDESDYKNHNWTFHAVDRIITIKNQAIQYAIENEYDALFLVDADLALHPQTLQHLESLNKDFVFEIFWTVFTDQLFAKPNCWDVHPWDYFNTDSILKLKKAGTYEVGAGGACTLISRNAMLKGLSFDRINNMPYKGEDRHICSRASVLGIKIFVDTHLPAFHIFNNSLLDQANQWVQEKCSPQFFNDWLDEKWEEHVYNYLKPSQNITHKNNFHKMKMALYKAKRAYINYMRYY
ncbi:MAG: hypothetical protein ACSHWW_07710 [Nonlabens sp.]|uniref:hypothetical protein n=1 Tax=Nonlabens sp. TaxID=1888209 RepID=UPI003EF36714